MTPTEDAGNAVDAAGAALTVRTEREGPVTTVVLSRPEVRNAVDGTTATALADAFRAFDADPEARVAVLWGEGGTFCSGADLKAVGTARGNRVAEDGDGPMGPTRLRLSKPVIAAISGHAVAGGLELALWCDLRVAEEDAVFGVFCRRWGVPLIDGGTVRLPRLIGASRAMDLVLTGRPVPADEAYAIGLANRLVPPGRARAEAERLASRIMRLPAEVSALGPGLAPGTGGAAGGRGHGAGAAPRSGHAGRGAGRRGAVRGGRGSARELRRAVTRGGGPPRAELNAMR